MSKAAKPISTTSHALLGLLALRPWTTYELAKQVQRSLGWFWPRAERKLYDDPKKLVSAGLATATEEHTGRRLRRVYAITADGRRALARWLDTPPAPPTLEFEAMIKVFFADAGTLDQLRGTLDHVEHAAFERVAVLRAMIEQDKAGDYAFGSRLPINALCLRFYLDYELHFVEWAAWAREQISTWRSPTDPGDWDWQSALDH